MTTSATETLDSGRQVGSGATSNWTLTSSDSSRAQLADPPVEHAQALDGVADDRQRVGRRVRRGERLRARRRPRPPGDSARSARVAASRSATIRSAWRAFSSMLRRSASAVSASVRRSRAPDSASRSRSSWVSAELALVDAPPAAWATASSATLSRPGFRSPRVLRSWSARSSFLRARLVPRSAPLIDAWSRSRSAPRRAPGRSARNGGPTRSSGRSPRSGCPVSSAMTWSARVGSVIAWPS